MNEGAKTGLFWCVAAVMVAIATFVAWPRSIDSDTSQLIGKPLFPDFEDPLVASNMKIVTYNEQQGTLSQFEVTKDPQTGIWKIPTHAGYPADAEEQMKASATALYDLTILDVPSRNAEDHAAFGVLEPDPEGLKVGDEGVGRLVDFRNEQGESVATLIVGDQVPDAPDQRYVRKPTQDVVYVVELDDEPLTTKFVDWIDNDLLQLTAFDIDRIKLNNYTASFDLNSSQVSQNKKFEAELDLEGADWTLEKLVTFKEGIGVPKPLGENEQLDTARLNELKRALDELKIAGVGRKPEGMSASLKADKSLINDQSAILSLLQRGFIPLRSEDGEEVEILAANGEMVVTQNNGVEYLLRFGDIADASADAVATEEEDETAPAGSNRYLLVTARVNESQIPVPELEEAPQTIEELDAAENASNEQPTGEPAAAEEAAEADPAAQPPATVTEIPAEASEEAMQPDAEENEPQQDSDAASDPQPATPTDEDVSAPQAEAESPDAESTENAEGESGEEEEVVEEVTGETTQSGGGSATGSGAGQDAAAQEEQESAAAQQDAPGPEDTEQAEPQNGSDAQPGAEEPAETEPVAATNDSAPASDAAGDEAADVEAEPAGADMASEGEADSTPQRQETEQEKRERLEAVQERIAKENQRKLDERAEKIEQARQRVAELNARFADWYYEISESTFRKLQLSQEELITTQEDAAASPNPAGGLPQSGAMPQFNLPGGP